MGQFRNEFNRDWNPYGGWEFGEDLSASLIRKAQDEADKAQKSCLAKFFRDRCMCCKRKFKAERIWDALCARCLKHAACSVCHAPVRDGRGDFLAIVCQGCSTWVDRVNALYELLRGPPSDAEKQAFNALKQERPRVLGTMQKCDNPSPTWIQEYRDCLAQGRRRAR